ncbi:unnamed protein product [Heligmosomoides polygyrus]|uniref:Helitron_like_N domain-containing protein n=1 Tax=Heligmosomoides polygyrus TaxID=6339 RepID=A0A183GTP4_HELPZ|nr:unnamed protein product [Heligmosomoides polygyrus]
MSVRAGEGKTHQLPSGFPSNVSVKERLVRQHSSHSACRIICQEFPVPKVFIRQEHFLIWNAEVFYKEFLQEKAVLRQTARLENLKLKAREQMGRCDERLNPVSDLCANTGRTLTNTGILAKSWHWTRESGERAAKAGEQYFLLGTLGALFEGGLDDTEAALRESPNTRHLKNGLVPTAQDAAAIAKGSGTGIT